MYPKINVVFVHGAPNGPKIWDPLITKLKSNKYQYTSLALPGFTTTIPKGFIPSIDSYVKWLISKVEHLVVINDQPIHIVGHDFGAVFSLRVCSLRPDLIDSWTIISSLIDSQLKPHKLIKYFRNPVLSTLLAKLITSHWLVKHILIKQGLTKEQAAQEVSVMNPEMYRCIKNLYTTAPNKMELQTWEQQLKKLPNKGMLIWGADDPYVPLPVAKRFAERWGYPLHIEENVSHWPIVEKPESVAKTLLHFWGK